jgi:hypothetical protein
MPAAAHAGRDATPAQAPRSVPPGWPGRAAAARALGISVRTLRRYEVQGVIPFVIDRAGVHRFDPKELSGLQLPEGEAFPNGRKGLRKSLMSAGQVAASVFARLSAGEAPRDVVVSMGMEPAAVVELHRQWLSMGNDIVISHKQRAQLKTALGVTFRTAEQLVQLVQEQADAALRARAYRYGCSGCGRSMEARADREWKWLVEAGALQNWACSECAASCSPSDQ